MSLNVLSKIYGPKRRVSICLRSALGQQDSRSYGQDFLKDTSGKVEDIQNFNRQPDQTVHDLKLEQKEQLKAERT